MDTLELDGLREALMGRRIVKAENNVLTLDNRSEVHFEEYGACCAWASVERMAEHDNVITDIRVEEGDDTVTIFALSSVSTDTEIAHIVGDEGTGYYSYGVEILVNGVRVDTIEQPGQS